MRKALIAIGIVAAVIFFARKTCVNSYVGTTFCQIRKEVKEHISTKFEIDRVRREIANLEGDVGNMIKPIAEHMATADRLRKDIAATETRLEEQRTAMLNLTKSLEGNPKFVTLNDHTYTQDAARRKLNLDFESFKRIEKHLKGQTNLLEAKEKSLKGTQDQIAKVVAKKREYELRLAQLEAEEEILQVSRMGSKVQFDDSRATQIEAALSEIEHRLNVQKHQIELANGEIVKVLAAPGSTTGQSTPRPPTPPSTDVNTIRQYLENSANPSKD